MPAGLQLQLALAVRIWPEIIQSRVNAFYFNFIYKRWKSLCHYLVHVQCCRARHRGTYVYLYGGFTVLYHRPLLSFYFIKFKKKSGLFRYFGGLFSIVLFAFFCMRMAPTWPCPCTQYYYRPLKKH